MYNEDTPKGWRPVKDESGLQMSGKQFEKKIGNDTWYLIKDYDKWNAALRFPMSLTIEYKVMERGFYSAEFAAAWVADYIKAKKADGCKPCPFCGCKDIKIEYKFDEKGRSFTVVDRSGGYYVSRNGYSLHKVPGLATRYWAHAIPYCPKCGAVGPKESFNIETFNMRDLSIGDKQRRTKAKKAAIQAWNNMSRTAQ